MSETESRVKKSLLNARVNILFYVLVLGVTFFSRKIFLDILGTDFVGLTSTLSNLLGMLSLAELGVGTAVGYMLYKPIFERDQKQINEIISVFGFIYQRIGFVIIAIALVLSCFLPMIFNGTTISMPLIYFAYFSFLTSSLLSYFANYKQTLLGADQKQYVVTGLLQSANILRLLIQIWIVSITRNLYYWVAMELIFALLNSFVLNWRIRKVYPWLHTNIKDGKLLFKTYSSVVTYTKQLFMHKIASLVIFNLSPILVYAFTSLSMVAIYTNYTMIADKIMQLIVQFFGSINAGVGHLVAQGDKEKVMKVFWELFSIYYLIAGVVVICLYFLIDPFIILWIGESYILSDVTVILILINLFFSITRVADLFLVAYGMFYDIWAPITEAIINASISLLLGSFLGLNGVLLGMTCSLLVIIVIWKPLFLFRKGFNFPFSIYIRKLLTQFSIVLSVILMMYFIVPYIPIDPSLSYWNWVLYALIILMLSLVGIVSIMAIFVAGMRDFLSRIFTLIKNKVSKQ